MLLLGTNLVTPLYAVYRERFGFSIAVVPLIFAAYTLILIPALLVFGQLSDRLGRRRVIIGGLGLAILALLMFAFARGTAWLVTARVLHGLAVGAASGAAAAALVELEPPRARPRAALLATLGQTGGSAAGPVIAGMLAAWAPWPRSLCFVVGAGAMAVAAAGLLTVPEPLAATSGRWQILRPRIPAEIRLAFARAAVAAGTVWAVAALFLSLIPTYAGRLLATNNLALLGAISGLLLAASCVSQVASRGSVAPRAAQVGGLVLVVTGLVALVLAFPLGSLALMLASALLAGVGHGLVFLGAQSDVNRIAPPGQRGEITAAFYAVIYFSVSVAVMGVALLTVPLSLFVAVAAFAGVTGGVAVLVVGWHLLERR